MKLFFTNIFFILLFTSVFAQNDRALEKMIVERYYIADKEDAKNDAGGEIKEGAVTYRIYADLRPGYIYQAAYGIAEHEMNIKTTTTFFNNEDRGSKLPTYTKTQARSNTVMLDSWLTVRSACVGQVGVLKTDDNGIDNVVNKDGILKNQDPLLGIPLTVQDGMVAGISEPVTLVGLDVPITIFELSSDVPAPHQFVSNDGAWAALNGAMGIDSMKNRILIAQITTDGILSFELNIQTRRNSDLKVENYVARNPIGSEIQDSTLIFNSSTITSIVNTEHVAELKAYPNPSNSFFYFNRTIDLSKSEMIVINSQGKQVPFTKMANAVDLNDNASGMYFLRISEGNKITTLKLLKL